MNLLLVFLFNIFLVLNFVLILVNSDVPRPRGVPLSKAPLYTPGKDFTCFDGSLTIPFNQVNDDYCDCFDGSDEPGTSACTNGVFHCTNAGHTPKIIPSSRVNDGVCDCCDATDEYLSLGSCVNNCEELGQEARIEAEKRAELYKAGGQIRKQLIEQGSVKRKELAEKLSLLVKDKAEAEALAAEKDTLKHDAEMKENEALKVYRDAEEEERGRAIEREAQATRDEAQETFVRFDSNADGILTIIEIQTRIAFDKNRDGQVDEEEAKYFLGDKQEVEFEEFVDNCWSLIKPFLMIEQGMFQPPTDAEKVLEETGEAEMVPEDIQDEDESHDEEDAEELDPEGQFEESSNPEAEEVHEEAKHYDEQTQMLIDRATEARSQHSEAQRALREIESNINDIKESLERDYGPHFEFATLDGQCFEIEDKEYVYKICLFGRVTQKSKSGGAEIGLGSWGEWAGSEDNKYSAMKYTGGVACWNGPNRSTLVNLKCGMETKILSVTEPYRCEYFAELSTPAACDDSKVEHISHDEL